MLCWDDILKIIQDPYVTRPLPHLIGSHGFHQEDDVGVGDLLSGGEIKTVMRINRTFARKLLDLQT